MQQTQLADKLPSEFEPLDWELGQDHNVTSPWILTIISRPRLPPDLYDTVSVTTLYPRELWIIFGT